MAVPPKFAGHKLTFGPPPPASSPVPHSTHTFELYADYCCPFSAKLFRTLTADLIPAIRQHEPWRSSLTLIFRQSVQPWHPSSTLMHEAALAVLRLAPDRFWDYSALLFEEQSAYFDASVVHETRNETYRRLADLAGRLAGVDAARVYDLLKISDKPAADGSLNGGNGVTGDLKLVTRMNRLVGVHVTPTVVFDGVVQDTSSGWTVEQWKEWLGKNVV
ncbi:hypothetical protein E4U41_003520 [Claviceps citrina]|nr:hypothetical protein E4U41_003520 [Claviceps citrina]